ncbi:MAG: hypothetical protein JW803_07455 [Endomicrobiales bacterium]|nr:hypothetical protein [Endomicrobiales bacterium]
MKKILPVLLLLPFILSCASAPKKPKMKATSPDTEVVEAEGMAPIINGDVTAAKKTSLHEALKNALGLVIGVYVSQEALVSKAMLIEDNITSQTEGYIERYDVLREWQEGDFYKTRVKALVRKEDLSAKIKALDLEPKKLGNPVVSFNVPEYIDGSQSETTYAVDEMKKKFIEQGFVVSDDKSACDILVTGRADANYNTDQGLGGMVSYRGTVSIKVIKPETQDVITTAKDTLGGADVSKPAAAATALSRAGLKTVADVPREVLKFLKERATVQLILYNIENMNKLNDITRSIRALIEVRDCRVRDYTEETAKIDLDLKKGTAQDVAKRIEKLSTPLKVLKTTLYSIEAEVAGK